jgi:hypothetical protein
MVCKQSTFLCDMQSVFDLILVMFVRMQSGAMTCSSYAILLKQQVRALSKDNLGGERCPSGAPVVIGVVQWLGEVR